MKSSKPWYTLKHPERLDSPALLVNPERIEQNIYKMIDMAGRTERLFVHVKTHKMPAVVDLQLKAGIRHFKCATIAEAEMLAESGAKDILLAYPLTFPKARRFLKLVHHYPNSHFSFLVDNKESVKMVNKLFESEEAVAHVFIDIDNGMHRSGIGVDQDIFAFYQYLDALDHINCRGLHVYDGHLHIKNFEERKNQALEAFAPVKKLIAQIEKAGFSSPMVVAGGTLTFPIHAEHPQLYCSPGTNILWDAGYDNLLPEQDFDWAAVLLTRIISKPKKGMITTDLGHKSVAAENPLKKRVEFLNLPNCTFISQSEEHLVLKVEDEVWQKLNIGKELYGIPQHICPTVALYDEVHTVQKNKITGKWTVTARKKKINF